MRIFLIISSLLLTATSIFIIIDEGLTWAAFGGVLLFGGGFLMFVFQKQWDSWSEKMRQKKLDSYNCMVRESSFFFPKGYYFRHGFLKSKKELPFDKITEIRTNTIPMAALVDNSELIFLLGLTQDDLKPVRISTHIEFTTPQDNWYLICEEFLDTEFDEEHQERILQLLDRSNINREEVRTIRKRLKNVMLLKTAMTWEWMYYGQYDVLKSVWPLTYKKYWWTMEIALRTGKNQP